MRPADLESLVTSTADDPRQKASASTERLARHREHHRSLTGRGALEAAADAGLLKLVATKLCDLLNADPMTAPAVVTAIVAKTVPSTAITTTVLKGSRKGAGSAEGVTDLDVVPDGPPSDNRRCRLATSRWSASCCLFLGRQVTDQRQCTGILPVAVENRIRYTIVQTRPSIFPDQLDLLAIFKPELSLLQILRGQLPTGCIEKVEDGAADHFLLAITEEARHPPIHERRPRVRINEPDALCSGLEHEIRDGSTQPRREQRLGSLLRSARLRVRAKFEVSVVASRHQSILPQT